MAFSLVPTQQGRTIVLDKPILFVGRHPECDVVLTRSRKVSRKHCCIVQVNQDFYVRDLGSMNGIRVNGERVKRDARIRIGDEITIGDVSYRLNTQKGLSQKAGADVTRKPTGGAPRPQPMLPADLSQDIPIPIPEDDFEDFDPEADKATPDAMPVHGQVAYEIPDDEVISLDDDAILEESGEFRDSNSHV